MSLAVKTALEAAWGLLNSIDARLDACRKSGIITQREEEIQEGVCMAMQRITDAINNLPKAGRLDPPPHHEFKGILQPVAEAQAGKLIPHPEGPISVNAKGGKQTHLPYRYDLLPPTALDVVAGIVYRGAAKYGADNWRDIEVNDHINHLLRHTFLFLAGDTKEYHLGNVACRALFALDLHHLSLPKEGNHAKL